jgi:hypothetical protein
VVNIPAFMRRKCGTGRTYRFEEDLSRVAKNEGETKDDGGKRDERRQGVGAVEDKQTEEDDDDKCDTEQDCVQFCQSRTCILHTVDESLSLLINPLDGFSHLFLGDIGVTVFIEYRKRSMLPIK